MTAGHGCRPVVHGSNLCLHNCRPCHGEGGHTRAATEPGMEDPGDRPKIPGRCFGLLKDGSKSALGQDGNVLFLPACTFPHC